MILQLRYTNCPALSIIIAQTAERIREAQAHCREKGEVAFVYWVEFTERGLVKYPHTATEAREWQEIVRRYEQDRRQSPALVGFRFAIVTAPNLEQLELIALRSIEGLDDDVRQTMEQTLRLRRTVTSNVE